MPLRDHFRPPLSEFTSWEGIHGGWPMVIVQQLGNRLPARYVAEPRVHLGSQVEIDVATCDHEGVRTQPVERDQTGPAAAVWAPAQPTLAVETELADFDEYEVRVYDVRGGRRLVAAVEIISPANKDRVENRHQFTAKCAALLRQGVSLAAARHEPLVGGVERPVDRGRAAPLPSSLAGRRPGSPARPGSELRPGLPRPAHRLTFVAGWVARIRQTRSPIPNPLAPEPYTFPTS